MLQTTATAVAFSSSELLPLLPELVLAGGAFALLMLDLFVDDARRVATWLLGMANSGLPGTSGFIGEFMVILASFQKHPLLAFTAAITLILGAAYTLWLVKRVIFGDVANAHVAELEDLNMREWIVLGVFAIGVLALGVYPKPLTDLMEPSIAQIASQLAASKL